MAKHFLVSLFFLFIYSVAHSQLYQTPIYPQNYFRWPTELTPDIVANMGELRPNHWHMGLDVRTNGKVNQRVFAAADGYIAFVGIEPLSWGRWIIINHPNGLSTLYGHLNNFRPDLEEYITQHQYSETSWETHTAISFGKFPVKKGDFIAYSGSTGGSQGPHVHWEVIDTKSDRRLNPSLFGIPITDAVAPAIARIALYDRSNSVYDQSPQIFKLTKSGAYYTLPGGLLKTNLQNLSFAIQAYDTRSGSGNQDGIYSARLFMDNREISSFYIDSIGYKNTRYINAQTDYKMAYNGGFLVQHISKLPGDKSGIYYDTGNNGIITIKDTLLHSLQILVSDAYNNTGTIQFYLQNNGFPAPVIRSYEWQPNRLNRVFKYDFEAYLPFDALYDKLNANYSRNISNTVNSVSAKHQLGSNDIPVQSEFEVCIKPDKVIPDAYKNRVVIKRSSKTNSVRKASWSGEWLMARFRDFGVFEAFVDITPPTINSLGAGDVVNLSKASRISFTPTDNFGIDEFRAEVDGQWVRFTNDKGRSWVYYFDDKISPGEHTLTVSVTDIAGNKTIRSWRFQRGGPSLVNKDIAIPEMRTPVKETPKSSKKIIVKKESAKNTSNKKNMSGKKTTAKKTDVKVATIKNKNSNKKANSKKEVVITKKKTVAKKKK